jgi:hypothetical protein
MNGLAERCWAQNTRIRPSFDAIMSDLTANNIQVLEGANAGGMGTDLDGLSHST